jgi:hypothetical protein
MCGRSERDGTKHTDVQYHFVRNRVRHIEDAPEPQGRERLQEEVRIKPEAT